MWTLIVVIVIGGSLNLASTTVPGFSSEATCQAAVAKMEAEMAEKNQHLRNRLSAAHSTYCIEVR